MNRSLVFLVVLQGPLLSCKPAPKVPERRVVTSNPASEAPPRSTPQGTGSSSGTNELPLPTTPSCSTLGIVGGTVASLQDLVTSSTVRLNFGQKFCSGTIIGPNHIVTAAHCIDNNTPAASIRIEFGTTPVADPNIRVMGYSMHPEFQGLFSPNGGLANRPLHDVAVLTFSGRLTKPYAPSELGSAQNLTPGAEVTLAGYGFNSDADKTLRPLTWVKKRVVSVDTQRRELQLQIGDAKGRCGGDSGGPAYIPAANGCLRTVSVIAAPGRESNGSCDQGSATLMDLTTYQGWLGCAYQRLGAPLLYLGNDDSSSACNRTTAVMAR